MFRIAMVNYQLLSQKFKCQSRQSPIFCCQKTSPSSSIPGDTRSLSLHSLEETQNHLADLREIWGPSEYPHHPHPYPHPYRHWEAIGLFWAFQGLQAG